MSETKYENDGIISNKENVIVSNSKLVLLNANETTYIKDSKNISTEKVDFINIENSDTVTIDLVCTTCLKNVTEVYIEDKKVMINDILYEFENGELKIILPKQVKTENSNSGIFIS